MVDDETIRLLADHARGLFLERNSASIKQSDLDGDKIDTSLENIVRKDSSHRVQWSF
jgi:hypothetical protein